MQTSLQAVLDDVVLRLNKRKTEWPRIAAGSKVPLSTLKKVAYGKTLYPRIATVENLAKYLRRGK